MSFLRSICLCLLVCTLFVSVSGCTFGANCRYGLTRGLPIGKCFTDGCRVPIGQEWFRLHLTGVAGQVRVNTSGSPWWIPNQSNGQPGQFGQPSKDGVVHGRVDLLRYVGAKKGGTCSTTPLNIPQLIFPIDVEIAQQLAATSPTKYPALKGALSSALTKLETKTWSGETGGVLQRRDSGVWDPVLTRNGRVVTDCAIKNILMGVQVYDGSKMVDKALGFYLYPPSQCTYQHGDLITFSPEFRSVLARSVDQADDKLKTDYSFYISGKYASESYCNTLTIELN